MYYAVQIKIVQKFNPQVQHFMITFCVLTSIKYFIIHFHVESVLVYT